MKNLLLLVLITFTTQALIAQIQTDSQAKQVEQLNQEININNLLIESQLTQLQETKEALKASERNYNEVSNNLKDQRMYTSIFVLLLLATLISLIVVLRKSRKLKAQ